MTHSNPYEPPSATDSHSAVWVIAPRTPMQRYSSYVIGTLLIIAAAFGLLYNWGSFSASLNGVFDPSPNGVTAPYFYTSFYIMSLICVVCYLALIVASIGLFRGSATCARMIACLLLFEVVYFFAVAFLWSVPIVGSGISAATGIANGGLMAQFLLLMPIWIPISLGTLGLYREGDSGAIRSA